MSWLDTVFTTGAVVTAFCIGYVIRAIYDKEKSREDSEHRS